MDGPGRRGAAARYWQVLPLGPTSFGDSPYQSYSAFAGEPLYIDLDQLAEAGLLKKGACKRVEWGEDPSHVDYDVVRTGRKKLLRKAFKNFEDKKALEAFRQENAEWVEDYALYMALKDKNKGRPWTEWKKGLRLRDPAALEECREKYKEDVDYYVFTQYLFFQQWGAGPSPGCSSWMRRTCPPRSPAARRTPSPPTASCGATPSTAGT